MKRRHFLAACAAALAAASPALRAQDRIVKIIVPFAPGGSADLIPRIIAQAMSEHLGETVIVENRAGAGGAVGTLQVARAAPDGMTLGVATVSTHAIQPAVAARPAYDPLQGFAPISNLASVPNIISVNPKIPVDSIAALTQLARNGGRELTYGSPGVGSLGHMMGELLAQATGAPLRHVPYRGAGPALQDTIAGHVDMLCDNLPASMPHVQEGRLRALAIAWPSRNPQLPAVPTFAEVGIPRLNDPAWFGLVAPAGTPPELVARLQAAAASALRRADIAARLAELGAVAQGGSAADFAGQIRAELEKWRQVARTAHISLEA